MSGGEWGERRRKWILRETVGKVGKGGGVEGWWKYGTISKIKALFPTGCKSPIEYGEGALEKY